MDVDYLVVEEIVNISKLFDYTCMLRMGCKPMMSTTWYLKLVAVDIGILYHLKHLHI
jgi:hypothetical protein